MFPHLLFHLYCFCTHTCTFIFTVSAPTPALSFPLFLLQHLHLHIYCSCSNISISISSVFVTTPVLPSLLTGSVPTPALPFLLFLFPRQLFRFYYLCFHTCSSIFTVSASTLALSFLLCQLQHLHFHLCCFCSYSGTDFSTASVATLALSFSLFRVSTVREKSGKTKNFRGQGKVREFFKKSGKIFDTVKVRKFCFPVYRSKLFFKTWNTFSLAKIKRMLQSKQSDQFDTLRLNVVVILWSLVFVVYDFLIIPSSLSAKSGKRLNMKRKMSMACKKN